MDYGKNKGLITVSGRKRMGKDTVSDMIVEMMVEKEQYFGKNAFGAQVKRIASMMTGIPADQWETTEHKDTYLSEEWDLINEDGTTRKLTRREFMTRLGTDACTRNLHINCWINMTFRDFKKNGHLVISDVRFLSEVDAIRKRKGYIIRVHNPRIDTSDSHPSESELDNYTDWDYFILNDGTLEELREKVRRALVELEIL